jgi:putative SOS response-associated peptidase YedK
VRRLLRFCVTRGWVTARPCPDGWPRPPFLRRQRDHERVRHAPTAPLPIVRSEAKDHRRRLQVMRWGLGPFGVKDLKAGFATINAKTEGV